MWQNLRLWLARLWHWSRQSGAERRAARVRARFWSELREGEREAAAQLRALAEDSARPQRP